MTEKIKQMRITMFGFWMQTLADLELLNLELQVLTDKYIINPINRFVSLVQEIERLEEKV